MTEKNMSDPSLGPPSSIPPNPAICSSKAPWGQCHVCRGAAQAVQAQVGSFPEGEVRMITVRAHGKATILRSMSAADDPWVIAEALRDIHSMVSNRQSEQSSAAVLALLTNYTGERLDGMGTWQRESHIDALRRIIAERDAAMGVPSTLPEE